MSLFIISSSNSFLTLCTTLLVYCSKINNFPISCYTEIYIYGLLGLPHFLPVFFFQAVAEKTDPRSWLVNFLLRCIVFFFKKNNTVLSKAYKSLQNVMYAIEMETFFFYSQGQCHTRVFLITVQSVGDMAAVILKIAKW